METSAIRVRMIGGAKWGQVSSLGIADAAVTLDKIGAGAKCCGTIGSDDD